MTSGRLSKLGTCTQCQTSDVDVSWHLGSRSWYCDNCWPRPRDAVSGSAGAGSRSWTDALPTAAQLLAERDRIYGVRLEDSAASVASFRVRCPEHGWLADNLALGQARKLRDAHLAEHGM